MSSVRTSVVFIDYVVSHTPCEAVAVMWVGACERDAETGRNILWALVKTAGVVD